MLKILLFDMDGVLLESLGYHRALQDTVRLAGEALGFRDVTLSMEDIAAFESVQVTSEWDSAATSAALLLVEAWRVDLSRRLPEKKLAPAPALQGVKAPAFKDFALRLGSPELAGLAPLQRTALLLLEWESFSAEQHGYAQALLARARTLDSVLFRTFQELALGSTEYLAAYGSSDGIAVQYNTESYLLCYDRSLLSDSLRQDLLDWLAHPTRRAVILTSRPNRPPAGVFGTPEAELGLTLAAAGTGLATLPISGWGNLCWLGERFRCDPQGFIKPDPVHALIALQLALGTGPEDAGERAYELSRLGKAHESWKTLQGCVVSIFEDTRGGLLSLKEAARLLGGAGIAVEVNLIGITHQEVKVRALQACGAQVYPGLEEALSDQL